MIKVYTKTDEEILKEENENGFYARSVKGIPTPVCATYVVKKDGARLDTSAMSEDEIISFLTQALKKGVEDRNAKTYNKDNKIDAIEQAFKLTEAIKHTYEPSWKGLKQILELYENKDATLVSFARDLFTPLIAQKLDKVLTIVKFNQECTGNFKNPTKEQIFATIDQISINEHNRNTQKSTTL